MTLMGSPYFLLIMMYEPDEGIPGFRRGMTLMGFLWNGMADLLQIEKSKA